MKYFVQFGAGNIGRSFIGQLFSRAGYEVIFIESALPLVRIINKKREYRIIIKKNDTPDEEIVIRNIQALHIDETQAVRNAILKADYVATSVGASALSAVAPILADGIEFRFVQRPHKPIDIIIAEYNELIVDRNGFKTEIPALSTITPVDNIKAYVDRKLFIHNLGHSAIAYIGYANFANDLRLQYIWQALEKLDIANKGHAAMTQAAVALANEYPNDFEISSLNAYIEDLFVRFSNKALGDTIYRVGRDLYRKLAHDERIIGAMILAAQHGLPFDAIAQVFSAALRFRATDEEGALFPRDAEFKAYWLSLQDPVESIVYDRLVQYVKK